MYMRLSRFIEKIYKMALKSEKLEAKRILFKRKNIITGLDINFIYTYKTANLFDFISS